HDHGGEGHNPGDFGVNGAPESTLRGLHNERVIPFEWTPESEERYEALDGGGAARLDTTLRALLGGGRTHSEARRHRVQSTDGVAFIRIAHSGMETIWHVHWDNTSPDRTVIILLAPIELKR
ncbi:MAG: hypothetical protein MUQ27_03985, partial [Acidimicrobiia bacterium]|nr:hypothetical protein [Acidimicrobiia bacterium]